MKLKGEKGLTIIEVIIVITLMMFTLLPLMALILDSMRGITRSRFYTQAMVLTQDRLERWKNTSYSNITDEIEYYYNTQDHLNVSYIIMTNVTESTDPPLKRVNVQTRWQWGNRTSSVQMGTIIHRW